MLGYVITAVFQFADGAIRPGHDLGAAGWGRGYRFSSFDGDVLTLVAEVRAPDRATAVELLLARAERWWAHWGGDALPAPSTLQVRVVLPEERVLAGRAGRGPDRLIAESAAWVAARLRATRAALADLEAPARARSAPAPGTAVTQEPRSLPEIEALLPGWSADELSRG